jgi:hypothetical protein
MRGFLMGAFDLKPVVRWPLRILDLTAKGPALSQPGLSL